MVFVLGPHLHDGSVAVGADAQTQLGIPGTLHRGILPDPVQSLRVLLERALRHRVVAANATTPRLPAWHGQGIGHAFWVDVEAGFTPTDQETLIQYIFALGQALAPTS